MRKYYFNFFVFFIIAIALDQMVKMIILNGFRYDGSVISIVFVKNTGIAFSMFSFLGNSLKYIQIVLLFIVALVFLRDRKMLVKVAPYAGLLVGAGSSNLLDRFIHHGVIDYIYYHYGFNFAVFNLADVIIDFAVFMIILKLFLASRNKISSTA